MQPVSSRIRRGRIRATLSVLCLLPALWLGGAVQASSMPGGGDRVPPALQLAQNAGVSLEQAVESVRKRTGGRILSANTQRKGGRTVHRIKVLTDDQRVRIIEVDARTGEWQ